MGMRILIQEQGNLPINVSLISSLSNWLCTYVGLFYDTLPTWYSLFFYVKIHLFVTEKSDQDPDPHDQHCFGSLVPIPDPDPH
jgi:hypothetical protein